MNAVPDHITSRLEEFTGRWDPSLRSLFKACHNSHLAQYAIGVDDCLADTDRPYWVWLPRAITRQAKDIDPGHGVEEVEWAQFCYYLTVRIEEELRVRSDCDKQLLECTRKFHEEGDIVLAEEFPRTSPFWKWKSSLLNKSLNAIVRRDLMVKNIRSDAGKLLEAYAASASVLRIGSVAVCIKCGMMKEYAAIEEYGDRLACVWQVAGDLLHLHDDLNAGRYSYVSRLLMQESAPPDGESVKAAILFGNGLDRITAEISRLLDAAVRGAEPLHLPETTEHVAYVRRRIDALIARMREEAIHHSFDTVFR